MVGGLPEYERSGDIFEKLQIEKLGKDDIPEIPMFL